MSAAGTPLISRSEASTPATGSLKSTSMVTSVRTTALLEGRTLATNGAVVSVRVYCHEAPGALWLNPFGGSAKSRMLWSASQVICTVPYGGCGKENVNVWSLTGETEAAAEVLISRSLASTSLTG